MSSVVLVHDLDALVQLGSTEMYPIFTIAQTVHNETGPLIEGVREVRNTALCIVSLLVDGVRYFCIFQLWAYSSAVPEQPLKEPLEIIQARVNDGVNVIKAYVAQQMSTYCEYGRLINALPMMNYGVLITNQAQSELSVLAFDEQKRTWVNLIESGYEAPVSQ